MAARGMYIFIYPLSGFYQMAVYKGLDGLAHLKDENR